MLNYLRQNIIRYIIFICLLIIAGISGNDLACVCLLIAQFLCLIELLSIDTYFENNAKQHLRVVRKFLISIGIIYVPVVWYCYWAYYISWIILMFMGIYLLDAKAN